MFEKFLKSKLYWKMSVFEKCEENQKILKNVKKIQKFQNRIWEFSTVKKLEKFKKTKNLKFFLKNEEKRNEKFL